MKSNQFKESSIKALNDWINDGHSIREIAFPELLDELLIYSRNYIFSINYKPTKMTAEKAYTLFLKKINKPTKMKQFKNRFAVTGDIIQLLSFEKELIKLGYTLGPGSTGKKDVFNYRSLDDKPAKFITVGFHGSLPGVYLPASNDGGARSQNLLYDLSSQFKEALYVASEEIKHPLLITEDGVQKYIDDKAWCVKGVKQELTHYFIKNGLDENSPWPGCKYFHTEKAALEHVDKNKLYSKRQIMEILNKSITRKTFYVGFNRTPVHIKYFDLEKIKKELNINP